MTKILISGATGMLGRRAMVELQTAEGVEVRGTGFSRASGCIDRLDLCDADAVRSYVQAQRPDVVIHCAAERRPDVSEKDPEGTRRLNIDSTRTLAECARDASAWMIFLSTDYVFDGTMPPYRPGDERNPLNFYGRTKCEGEDVVRAVVPDGTVLRVPILYGDVETLDESPVTVIAQSLLARQGEEIVLDGWQTRFPTLVDDVAVVLRQMISHRLTHPEFTGVFHWSGDEGMTKYDMGVVMSRLMGLPTETLVKNQDPPGGAPRPKDCRLDCSDLEALGIGQRTPFETRIGEVLAKPGTRRC